MSGERNLLVEDEVGRRLELVGGMAGRSDPARFLDLRDDRVHCIGIDAVRTFPHQAEHDSPARSMADPGIGE